MSAQAVWLQAPTKPLQVGPADVAKPDDNEVVIKNHAVAINPVDWKQQDLGIFVPQFPAVLGVDCAGVISAVGQNARFKIGDRVIGHPQFIATGQPKHAAFQTYTVVPASRVAKISISFEDAVVLPSAISTAADGLYRQEDGFIGLPLPGTVVDSVLVVYGGSSSIGITTIQLAVNSGARVISTASEKNFDLVRQAGATVFDYKDPDVVKNVVNEVKKDGTFLGVFDAISNEDSYRITIPILEALGGGNLAVVQSPPNVPSSIKVGEILAVRATADPIWADFVESALESGKLKCLPPPRIVGHGLDAIQDAVDISRKGVSAQKIVVTL